MPLLPALPGAACRSVVGDNDRQENIRNIKKGFSDLYACTVSCKYFQNPQEAAQRDQGGGGSRRLEAGAYLIAPAAAKCLAQFPPRFSVIGRGTCFIFQLKHLGALPSLPLSLFFFRKASRQFFFQELQMNPVP